MKSDTLKDFGDWLSPIIVKELRQGMRGGIFTTSFIALQVLLVFSMLFALNGSSNSTGSSAVWFWTFVGAALVFVMPMRGFGSLSNETRLDTMDLLALTHMSPYRIAWGKFAAIFSQSLLLTLTILPYVVMRYFGGGINILGELLLLLLALTMSSALTAFMIFCSSLTNFLVRALFGLAMVVTTFAVSVGILESTLGYRSNGIPFGTSGLATEIMTSIVICGVLLTWYFISMAATRIASEAYNYSTLRRLVGLGVIGFLSLMAWIFQTHMGSEVWYWFSLSISGVIALDVITESPSNVRSVHLPFIRGGLLGRLAQIVLTPGWLSGAFYMVLLIGLTALAEHVTNAIPNGNGWEFIWHFGFLNSSLVPITFAVLFFRRSERFSSLFFVMIALALLAMFVILMAEEGDMEFIAWIFAFVPSIPLYLADVYSGSYSTQMIILAISIATSVLCLLILIVQSRSHLRTLAGFRASVRGKGTAP